MAKTKKFIAILLIIAAGLTIYYYRLDFARNWRLAGHYLFYKPCQEPIGYALGEIDGRFDIGRDDFFLAIGQAENIWEEASGRELFSFNGDSRLKINLVYDYRQDTTYQLDDFSLVLDQSNREYEKLKADYESSLSGYEELKRQLDQLAAEYQSRLSRYETEVKGWNKRGGASKDEYERLNREKAELEALLAGLRARQDTVNKIVAQVNNLAEALNRLGNELNLNIEQYNMIGESLGPEFEQGNFMSGMEMAEINVYQYNNKEKLVRVLAHELGHALGLDHAADPEAIMHSLNIGANKEVTAEDLAMLEAVCSEPTNLRQAFNRLTAFLKEFRF